MCKEAHEKQILLSNSGSQGPAHGLRTKLPRGIDRIRGSLKVHQHSETSIKPLEDIPTVGELEFRVTPGDRNILNLGHKLITVLDPDISEEDKRGFCLRWIFYRIQQYFPLNMDNCNAVDMMPG